MSILTKFKSKKLTVKDEIEINLIAEKKALSDQLLTLAIDDDVYEITLSRIETIDSLITKKEKKSKKSIDPVIISAIITTLGFVGVSLASMKYEDDGNIIQHTAGKNAMNKLGR